MKERSPLELSIFAADVNLQSGARPRASRRNAQTIYREDLQPLPYPKFEYTAQSIISPTQEMSLVGPGATTFLHVGLERKPLGTKHYNSKTLHDIDNVTLLNRLVRRMNYHIGHHTGWRRLFMAHFAISLYQSSTRQSSNQSLLPNEM